MRRCVLLLAYSAAACQARRVHSSLRRQASSSFAESEILGQRPQWSIEVKRDPCRHKINILTTMLAMFLSCLKPAAAFHESSPKAPSAAAIRAWKRLRLPSGGAQRMSIVCTPSSIEETVIAPDSRCSQKKRKFQAPGRALLEAPFEELVEVMGGSGKASAIWRALREGSNPLEVPLQATGGGRCVSLGSQARNHLRSFILGDLDDWGQSVDELLIPCVVGFESLASDGTRKYLSTLYDGNRIESVLIPSSESNAHVRTTLCVSTQIGCDRGCRFCATAKMGLIRNLTATEIIAQVVRGMHISKREGMPALNNIVFMGMGDAGRNVDEVGAAVQCITDDRRLAMAVSRVTVSTVGPSPEVFQQIARLPCMISWSLHAADNALRKMLVPSTQHSIEELRDGLIRALESRSSNKKTQVMIAVTLIHDVNDSEEDAKRVADFLRPILQVAEKIKVNLIPYNDIQVKGFSKPNDEQVNKFWRVLQEEGYVCTKRTTRGDEDSAACGMLKTKRDKVDKKNVA